MLGCDGGLHTMHTKQATKPDCTTMQSKLELSSLFCSSRPFSDCTLCKRGCLDGRTERKSPFIPWNYLGGSELAADHDWKEVAGTDSGSAPFGQCTRL